MRTNVERLVSYAPVWQSSPVAKELDQFDLEDWALEADWQTSQAASRQGRPWLYHPATRFALAAIGALGICAFALGLIAALYMIKSAFGINLFAEHSMLHDWLYVK